MIDISALSPSENLQDAFIHEINININKLSKIIKCVEFTRGDRTVSITYTVKGLTDSLTVYIPVRDITITRWGDAIAKHTGKVLARIISELVKASPPTLPLLLPNEEREIRND